MCTSFELQEIVERIEKLCSENNVDVKRMLTECGLSRNVVDNMKNGSKPSIDKIQAISDYFNVTVDYLLGREKPLPARATAEEWLEILNQMSTEELLNLLDQLTEQLRQKQRDQTN